MPDQQALPGRQLQDAVSALGFKPAPRLEQVGDEHSERVQDRKHRSKWCNYSASQRESTPGEISGKDMRF
jgi:hypothetical protein